MNKPAHANQTDDAGHCSDVDHLRRRRRRADFAGTADKKPASRDSLVHAAKHGGNSARPSPARSRIAGRGSRRGGGDIRWYEIERGNATAAFPLEFSSPRKDTAPPPRREPLNLGLKSRAERDDNSPKT